MSEDAAGVKSCCIDWSIMTFPVTGSSLRLAFPKAGLGVFVTRQGASPVFLWPVVAPSCELLMTLSLVDRGGITLRVGTGEPVSRTMDLSFLARERGLDDGVDGNSGLAGSEVFMTVSSVLRSAPSDRTTSDGEYTTAFPVECSWFDMSWKRSAMGENAGAVRVADLLRRSAIEVRVGSAKSFGCTWSHGVAFAASLSEAINIAFSKLSPCLGTPSRD